MPVSTAPPATRLVKPTLETRLHVDYDWWGRHERELWVYLKSHLCPEHQAAFADLEEGAMVDWVDPETAEVQPVNGVQHALVTHCARRPEFLTRSTSLVDAVFRVFLTNGNTPLTPEELGEKLSRPPDTILRTLSGGRVYKGLRPVLEPAR